MWPFASKPAVMPLSEKVRVSLTTKRGLRAEDAIAFRMLQERGQYSGRPVTYFRVFDPQNAKWAGGELHHYGDLDVSRILHSGHAEQDGQIVLYRSATGT